MVKQTTVYIGNLNYNCTKKDLFKLFSKFGKVKQVNMMEIPGSDKHKGIAFVHMFKAADAERAIKSLNGKEIEGRTVKVSEALDNRAVTEKPSPIKQEQKQIQEQVKEKKSSKRRASSKPKKNARHGLAFLFENTGKKKS